MKARHRSAAEALRFVIDDLQSALVEAPDAEIVEQTRGCWLPGAEAGRVRMMLQDAMRRDPEGLSPARPGLATMTHARGVPARGKAGRDDER